MIVAPLTPDELLGLPGDIRQGALIPTAYYTGQTFRSAPPPPRANPAAPAAAAPHPPVIFGPNDLGLPS